MALLDWDAPGLTQVADPRKLAHATLTASASPPGLAAESFNIAQTAIDMSTKALEEPDSLAYLAPVPTFEVFALPIPIPIPDGKVLPEMTFQCRRAYLV